MSVFIHKSLKIKCSIYTISTVKKSAVLGSRQILVFSLGNKTFFLSDSNANYEVIGSILAIVIIFILLSSYSILRLLVALKLTWAVPQRASYIFKLVPKPLMEGTEKKGSLYLGYKTIACSWFCYTLQ